MRDRIDKYELHEPLSSGPSGVVVRAFDTRLKRFVALKVITPETGVSDEMRARLLSQAQLWSGFSHPNLVSIHDVGEEDGISYVVFELPDGPTLEQLLTERVAIPLEEKITMMMQLCSALHYAHQRGIVHGDIRPRYILVPGDGAVKLGDFSVDKPTDLPERASEQLAAQITPQTAPELLYGRADARSDQYSLGAVFYELLSFVPPLRADTPAGLAEALRSQDRRNLAEVTSEVPRDLVAIVERAMHPDPARRYPDLRAMRADLEDVLIRVASDAKQSTAQAPERTSSDTAPPTDRPAAARKVGTPPKKKSPWLDSNRPMLALAAIALLSLALALWPSTAPQSAPVQSSRVPANAAPHDRGSTAASAASTREQAEAARDRALAARYASTRAEATYYAPDLHLAAQRKEAEADTAVERSDFATAAVLYDMARDGYEIAQQKSSVQAAQADKASVDAQMAADTRLATAAEPNRSDPKVTVSSADILARPPVVVSSVAPPAATGTGIHPKIVEPLGGQRETSDKTLAAYAAVFAEPTDGNRHGGTWGACWRSDPSSARQCAKASCEGNRSAGQPCIQVALSRPGQHCAVARAEGFGVTWGACGSTRSEAENAAIAGCREEASRNYGSNAGGCTTVWSTSG